MIETVNPYLCTDAPIWYGRIRLGRNVSNFTGVIERATLPEAQKTIEALLTEHFGDVWYLEERDDGFEGFYYALSDQGYGSLRPATVDVMSNFLHEWSQARGRNMIRSERISDKAAEMYALLRDLAPNDPRVLDIMGYVEEYSLI